MGENGRQATKMSKDGPGADMRSPSLFQPQTTVGLSGGARPQTPRVPVAAR
jgi:hypothetical protein